MQILTIQTECAPETPGATWQYGSEMFVCDCHLWIKGGFDLTPYETINGYDEDELDELAEKNADVRYAYPAPVTALYTDIVIVDGVEWHLFKSYAKVCGICNKQIAENDDYHDYHEPECPRYRVDSNSDWNVCGCNGIAHAECCPECKEDDMDSITGFVEIDTMIT